MPAKKNGSVKSLSYIVRSETYEGLTFGTPVRVKGERGKWAFRHHCINTDTGSEWIDVFGGEPGAETLRAFHTDRVSPVGVRKPRKPRQKPAGLSLEDLI